MHSAQQPPCIHPVSVSFAKQLPGSKQLFHCKYAAYQTLRPVLACFESNWVSHAALDMISALHAGSLISIINTSFTTA